MSQLNEPLNTKTTPWTASRLFLIAFVAAAVGLLLLPFAGPGIAFVFWFIGFLIFGESMHRLIKLIEWYILTRRQ